MRQCLTRIVIIGLLATASFASDAPTTRPATQPLNADEMLSKMLKPTNNAESKPLQPAVIGAPEATSGTGAVAPGAPQLIVMREGSFVVDRMGRLTPSADGRLQEFTFEADGKALQDPPVVVLPNLNLMKMEDAVQAMRRDLKFRITGSVTEYRGRNYVLVEKVVVVPEITQQF